MAEICRQRAVEREGGFIMTKAGASQGIGAGLVRTFLERGYCVVANARHITTSGAFEPSAKLALVDGDIGDNGTSTRRRHL